MKVCIAIVALVTLTGAVGCSSSNDTASADLDAQASRYRLATAPEGAMPVGQARKQVKDDEQVTLVGLIGGSPEPFIEGLAAFTIVDPQVPYCAADEGCPTPWDYCCQTDAVKENIATVQIVDENGQPLMSDARTLLDVKELSTVTVQGKAKRDPQGNLAVHATKLFVRDGK